MAATPGLEPGLEDGYRGLIRTTIQRVKAACPAFERLGNEVSCDSWRKELHIWKFLF